MGILLKLTQEEMIFRTTYITKNIICCNLHLHGWFSQAQSHIQCNSQAKLDFIADLCLAPAYNKLVTQLYSGLTMRRDKLAK